MAPVRAIFFDIGDTLVFDDPPRRERFGAALRAAFIPYSPRRLAQAFRIGEDYALTQYLQGLPWDDPAVMRETTVRVLVALGLPPLSESEWRDVSAAFAAVPFTRRVPPQAMPLLTELHRRGFVIGAISDWDETLPRVLTDLGLAPYFSALAVSAAVGVRKPAPALFQDALRQTGIAPDECLHVGDWYALDVAGARSAGMQTLLFDHAGRSPGADCARVQTFLEMQEYLLALPPP